MDEPVHHVPPELARAPVRVGLDVEEVVVFAPNLLALIKCLELAPSHGVRDQIDGALDGQLLEKHLGGQDCDRGAKIKLPVFCEPTAKHLPQSQRLTSSVGVNRQCHYIAVRLLQLAVVRKGVDQSKKAVRLARMRLDLFVCGVALSVQDRKSTRLNSSHV